MNKWETWPHKSRDYRCEKLYQAYLAEDDIQCISKEATKRLQWFTWHYQHGNNIRLTCRHFGIHHTTFYKWQNAYDPNNLRTLESGSKRPHKFRESKIPTRTQDLISGLRKEYPAWSKYKLKVMLKKYYGLTLSASSIGRILKKKGLINVKASKKRRKAALNPKLRAKATKYKYPGSHVEVDTKHVYLFAGYRLFQFTAIDSVTKLRVLRMFPTNSSHNAALFLREMIKAFPFKVVNIQTDNGSEFKGVFSKDCGQLKIKHYFSFPASPEQNGIVERSHRTDEEEFYQQGNCGDNLDEQRELLKRWEHTYNHKRPHQALGYLTPIEYFEKIKPSMCR